MELAELPLEAKIEQPADVLVQTTESSKADGFIKEWKIRFELKCKRNPHLVLPVLHTVIGAILRDTRVYYDAESFDLRTSLLVVQDSGTGKKPAMEFTEAVIKGVLPKFRVKRRRTITSAGALGALKNEEATDSATGSKVTKTVPIKGDLEEVDFISVSEAGSLLETRQDQWGNDLIRDICESQDTNNKLSRRLRDGEVPEFTSKTILSLWSVPPTNISTLVTRSGLIQRFIPIFKIVPFKEYQELRDELVSRMGIKVDEEANVQPLIVALKNKPVIREFEFNPETREAIIKKGESLDEMLLDAGADYVERLKSFTVRREVLLTKLAVHHAWLDERKSVEPLDVEYAFDLLKGLWESMLEFFEDKWCLADTNDKEQIALKILEACKPVEINTFYNALCHQAQIHIALARRIAKNLESQGYVCRTGEKKNRFITRLK